MAKSIIWTSSAQNDRKAIFRYWNKRNKSNLYSQKLNQFFKTQLKAVSYNPKIGVKTKYNNVRVITFRDYQIFYLVATEIKVITIWDTRMNPDKLEFNFK